MRRILATAEEEREERLRLLKREEERIKGLAEELERKRKSLESRQGEDEAKSAKIKELGSLYKKEKEAREDLEEEMAQMRRRMEEVFTVFRSSFPPAPALLIIRFKGVIGQNCGYSFKRRHRTKFRL